MAKISLLSIVTVNFKNLEGLVSTYQSILNQSNQFAFEWIVIDGGSDDGTKEFISNLSATFPINFISEKDSGIYNAMNKGIALSKNEFILFLNSGDTFYDHSSIDQVIANINGNRDIDLLLFGFKYVNKLHMPRPLWWRYWSMPTSHQAMIYSRDLLHANPYKEVYSRGGDFEHFLRVAPKLKGYKTIPSILSVNEFYGSNANMEIVKKEYEIILSEFISPFMSMLLVKFKFFYLNLRASLD
jgi:putative colanic acid biosynthesis glycosyltransferase